MGELRCSTPAALRPHCRIVLPYVGELRALTIGHNDMGPGPEWHLEMVEVRTPCAITFPRVAVLSRRAPLAHGLALRDAASCAALGLYFS